MRGLGWWRSGFKQAGVEIIPFEPDQHSDLRRETSSRKYSATISCVVSQAELRRGCRQTSLKSRGTKHGVFSVEYFVLDAQVEAVRVLGELKLRINRSVTYTPIIVDDGVRMLLD